MTIQEHMPLPLKRFQRPNEEELGVFIRTPSSPLPLPLGPIRVPRSIIVGVVLWINGAQRTISASSTALRHRIALQFEEKKKPPAFFFLVAYYVIIHDWVAGGKTLGAAQQAK
ncbi:hypothetical protein EI94DRAFT_1704654 [Lactarius quietus]|nr:hypothetical protein EI94DRAFT_1704654 [Lactarius quietus]